MAQAHKKTFDQYLLTPEFLVDPYSFYHQLRSTEPVYWSDGLRAWFLTRYVDVGSALRDPRLNSGDRIAAILSQLPHTAWAEMQPLAHCLTKWMSFTDPPDHYRLRTTVSQAFSSRIVARLRPLIQMIVDELLNTVQGSGQVDLIRDFAFPLPAIVIADLLGIPREDLNQFKQWSDDIAGFVSASHVTLHKAQYARQSLLALTDYFHKIVMQRRQRPREDLITTLVTAERQGSLNEDELISMCIQLLFAGHETTVGLIGNGLLALIQNPDQLQKLRDDPSLVVTAVEEFLRYDAPVQRQARVAREDLEIGGRQIRQGQYVLLFIAAANRDPAQFSDPDRLDITRQENQHVSFGQGIHFCIGAPLARLEAQIAINTVLRRMPTLRLANETLEWEELLALRKLKSLPITF